VTSGMRVFTTRCPLARVSLGCMCTVQHLSKRRSGLSNRRDYCIFPVLAQNPLPHRALPPAFPSDPSTRAVSGEDACLRSCRSRERSFPARCEYLKLRVQSAAYHCESGNHRLQERHSAALFLASSPSFPNSGRFRGSATVRRRGFRFFLASSMRFWKYLLARLGHGPRPRFAAKPAAQGRCTAVGIENRAALGVPASVAARTETYRTLVPVCRLERLERRELGEAQLRHDVRILGAETLIILPCTPCGASGIDQTTLGDLSLPKTSSAYDHRLPE
jgi:hypothetical protein